MAGCTAIAMAPSIPSEDEMASSKPGGSKWLERLSRVACGGRTATHAKEEPRGMACTTYPWSMNHDKSESESTRSFDFVNAMEQGFAQLRTSSFATPSPLGQSTTQLLVERSEDRSEYVLKGEGGEALLVGRISRKGSVVEISIPASGSRATPPVATPPVFRFTARDPKQSDWVLTSATCTCCAYLPSAGYRHCTHCAVELLRVQQTNMVSPECEFLSMLVDLPGPNSTGEDAAIDSAVRLVSRQPRWNPRLNQLTLSFFGRVKLASAKNFQLSVQGKEADLKQYPELLYGKVGDNKYVLDYKHPLSMVQAFALALSVKEVY